MTPEVERGPGRPRRLSEQQVLDAALDVLHERGVGGLSMRAVARRLDVPTMTVYGYVPNKQALEGLVTDHILSKVQVPIGGTWEERLHGLLCAARATLVDEPQLTDGATVHGSTITLLLDGELGPEATRLADDVMSLLHEGPFEPDDLHVCFSALFTYVTGHVDPHATALGVPRSGRGAGEHRPDDEAFGRGLTALIAGLKLTVGGDATTSGA